MKKQLINISKKLIHNCLNKKMLTKETLTEKLDKILLNPILAYPLFLLIMAFMFEFTFSWVGQPISD